MREFRDGCRYFFKVICIVFRVRCVVFKVCDTGIDKGIDVSMSRLGRIALKNHTSSAGCAL